MSKNVIAGLALLVLCTNAWWLYRTVDQETTLMYLDLQMHEYRQRGDTLAKLFNVYVEGTEIERLEAIIMRELPDEPIFVKEDRLHLPFVQFELRGDGTVGGVE